MHATAELVTSRAPNKGSSSDSGGGWVGGGGGGGGGEQQLAKDVCSAGVVCVTEQSMCSNCGARVAAFTGTYISFAGGEALLCEGSVTLTYPAFTIEKHVDHGVLCLKSLSCVLLQVGSELTLADVSALCAALPLFTAVLSAEARQPYPALTAWISSTSQDPHFSRVLGEWRALQRSHQAAALTAGNDNADVPHQQQQGGISISSNSCRHDCRHPCSSNTVAVTL